VAKPSAIQYTLSYTLCYTLYTV